MRILRRAPDELTERQRWLQAQEPQQPRGAARDHPRGLLAPRRAAKVVLHRPLRQARDHVVVLGSCQHGGWCRK
jgi:hypothetical protein